MIETVPPPGSAPATQSAAGWRSVQQLVLARGSVLAVVLALTGAVIALQLWRADLTVPLRYGAVDDTKFYLMLVKGIIDHGWDLTNSSLGVRFTSSFSTSRRAPTTSAPPHPGPPVDRPLSMSSISIIG